MPSTHALALLPPYPTGPKSTLITILHINIRLCQLHRQRSELIEGSAAEPVFAHLQLPRTVSKRIAGRDRTAILRRRAGETCFPCCVRITPRGRRSRQSFAMAKCTLRPRQRPGDRRGECQDTAKPRGICRSLCARRTHRDAETSGGREFWHCDGGYASAWIAVHQPGWHFLACDDVFASVSGDGRDPERQSGRPRWPRQRFIKRVIRAIGVISSPYNNRHKSGWTWLPPREMIGSSEEKMLDAWRRLGLIRRVEMIAAVAESQRKHNPKARPGSIEELFIPD